LVVARKPTLGRPELSNPCKLCLAEFSVMPAKDSREARGLRSDKKKVQKVGCRSSGRGTGLGKRRNGGLHEGERTVHPGGAHETGREW